MDSFVLRFARQFVFDLPASLLVASVAPGWWVLTNSYLVLERVWVFFSFDQFAGALFPLFLAFLVACGGLLTLLGWFLRGSAVRLRSRLWPGWSLLFWSSASVASVFGWWWALAWGFFLRWVWVLVFFLDPGPWRWVAGAFVLGLAGLPVFLVVGFLFFRAVLRLCLRVARGFGRSLVLLSVVLGWACEVLLFLWELPIVLSPWRLAPPVPLGGELGFSGLQRAGVDLAAGQAWSASESVGLVSPVGLAADASPRLRPRGLLTRRLQVALELPRGRLGSFLRGRWTPDLPSSARSPFVNAYLATRKGGAKLLGVGAVRSPQPDQGLYALFDTPHGRELVFPALWGKLALYALMRQRTPELALGLRARAAQWFKEVGLPLWVVPLALPCAVSGALLVPVTESLARAQLVGAGLGTLLEPPC